MARRTITLFAAVAVIATAFVFSQAGPASAASPLVDFTVEETLPVGTPGSLVASDIPGCSSATVATTNATGSTKGPVTTFTADKSFDCGGGDTFTLSLVARVIGCAATDSGSWHITGGTGAFEGAHGGGRLVGTYTLGGAPSDSCSTDGINDNYIGVIVT